MKLLRLGAVVCQRSALALLLGLGGCAQILDIPETIACGSDDACTTNDNPCVLGECVDGTCAFTLVAQGEVVGELEAGDCQRLVCDGEGNAVTAADPADAPPDPTAGDCVAPGCSETGAVVDAPAEDAPADEIAGDCMSPTCVDGEVVDAPAEDAPTDDVSGDCSTPACDSGEVVALANDDDAPGDDVPGNCESPTCQDGAVVLEPNPADTPPDITGDCLAAECGAQGLQPDDTDLPTTNCGGCSNGVVVPWAEVGLVCYTGNPSELGVPNTACNDGVWVCVDNAKICEGEQLPLQESCGAGTSGVDDDCNGQTDESGPGCACQLGMTQTCYEGPPGTGGVGTCSTGTSACMATPQGNQYGACVGDTFPEACDSCLVAGDEDCSGSAATCTGSHVFSKGITNVDGFTSSSVISLPNGEILVAGTFSGSLTAPNTITSDGGIDIALIRFDADGNAINAREFGGAGQESGNLVLLDDGYALVGTLGTGSAETFGSGSTLTAVGNGDGFVVKFNLNHSIAWKKLVGGSGADNVRRAARMPDNGLVLTGDFEGTLSLGGTNLVSAGSSDVFASRLEEDGDFVWSFRLGSNLLDLARAVTTNASGSILLQPTVPAEIRLYSSDGALQWTRSWAESSTSFPFEGVLLDDGTSWVGGYMGSAVNVDGTAGTDFTPTGSGQDLLFVKYSATGALLDGVSFNGTSGSSVSSMSLSPDGGVVASGGFSGTLFLPLSSSAAVGSFDAFLLKFDSSDGDFLWGRKHGGANVDGFGGLTTLGCGDILTTGSYRSTGVDFGGGALPYSGSGSTIGNGVLAKYRP